MLRCAVGITQLGEWIIMARYGHVRVPCPNDYPEGCGCPTCVSDRRAAAKADGRSPYQTTNSRSASGRFEGKEIKVITGATGRSGRFEFFYGGIMSADGPGHGHVVCNDGESINFWRKPSSEGGQTVIDDNRSSERLSGHMF